MSRYLDNPRNVLRLSSHVLLVGALLLGVGLYGAYCYEGELPLRVLVSMHALAILGPTLLKVGYVMRLLAQRQLDGLDRSAACGVA